MTREMREEQLITELKEREDAIQEHVKKEKELIDLRNNTLWDLLYTQTGLSKGCVVAIDNTVIVGENKKGTIEAIGSYDVKGTRHIKVALIKKNNGIGKNTQYFHKENLQKIADSYEEYIKNLAVEK